MDRNDRITEIVSCIILGKYKEVWSQMEWAPFRSLFWNIFWNIFWLYCKLNEFFYKRRFFVRQTLLLKYVNLWQRQQIPKTYDNIIFRFSLVVEQILSFWQEIWRTSIHLFKVCWNDHLVNYFPLMYRYGINTNILHLTFSRAEFWSFPVKC